MGMCEDKKELSAEITLCPVAREHLPGIAALEVLCFAEPWSEKALELLGRPFEDDIFLYCEENFLGHKLKRMGIPLYYTSRVSVRHMEDGSSAFYKHKINAEMEKSVAKYYDLLEKTKK